MEQGSLLCSDFADRRWEGREPLGAGCSRIILPYLYQCECKQPRSCSKHTSASDSPLGTSCQLNMPGTQCGAATLPSHPGHALPGMLVAILAVCSLETLLFRRHHRQGREAWIAFSILGGKSVDNWGENIMGKALGECIRSKRCYIPPEPLLLKGDV